MTDTREKLRRAAVAATLRSTPVFAGLSPDDLAGIASFSRVRLLAKDDYLFRQNEPAQGFYIVRRGLINVHRVGTDGREQVIHLFRPGESFAENTLASSAGHLTHARAAVESEVVCVPKWEFLQILRERADIALRIMGSMSHHMRGLISSLENITLKDAETRLLHWILKRCPRPLTHEPAEVAIGMTKAMLGAEIGTRQETLSRTLASLRKAGHIDVRGRLIKVPDPIALRALFQDSLAGRPTHHER